jgi:pimeloyl-ACP methyl ester carboxylesterase
MSFAALRRFTANMRTPITTLFVAALAMSTSAASAAGGPKTTKTNKPTGGKQMTAATMKSGHADSNGVKIYYEVHGDRDGVPLVLLHGAFMTIDINWASLLPALTPSRKVIAIELRGHGHSTDAKDPFSCPTMAADVAAVLRHLQVTRADVLGYSMGGIVATALALRHPDLVRKLIVMSAVFENSGWEPDAWERLKALPDDFAPKVITDVYEKIAPDPKHWPVLVRKVKQMIYSFPGWPENELRALKAPLLIVLGDREGCRIERAVAVSRLVPTGQIGVIPDGDHFFLWSRPDLLLPMISAFLDK